MDSKMPLVVANWKMHGSKLKAQSLLSEILPSLSGLKKIDVAFCPPFVYLPLVRERIQDFPNVFVGAQDVYFKNEGAFTGEISPDMLTDIGARFVIVGHSERRQLFQETDALVARKFEAAYHAGLIPILCVGETADERRAGKTFEVLNRQVQAVFELEVFRSCLDLVIAYEPVWAIGTGLSASPEQAEEAHVFLRRAVAEQDKTLARVTRILYGGSVTAENAQALFMQPNIDGGLIGGASLKAQAFVEICEAAELSFNS